MQKNTKKFWLSILAAALITVSGCQLDRNNNTFTAPAVEETAEMQGEKPETSFPSGDTSTDAVKSSQQVETQSETQASSGGAISLSDIPAYSGEPYVVVNDNIPFFTEADLTDVSFEYYSPLDSLGRCGAAYANIGQDLMPTEDRGDISDVHPTGWEQKQYDIVDGGNLYNRCHLIGYQLTAENANEENLITGTRYLNVEGMLPFENMVADYIKETGNHVLYRVTPLFDGDNLVASGVEMEAESVEDKGNSILFHVFCYNVQPGITINYATGDSQLSTSGTNETTQGSAEQEYVFNTNTKKFHLPSCSSVQKISDKNKETYAGSRDTLIQQGYDPCKTCNP